jgi:hypothetical protein
MTIKAIAFFAIEENVLFIDHKVVVEGLPLALAGSPGGAKKLLLER